MVQNNSSGDRLRIFALSKCQSIKDFADLIGMDSGNVQKYLNEKRKPGSSFLKRLQKEGCDINWLLTGEGEMYTQKEDDREDETKKEQESNSPTVHQAVNAQLTPAQQTINGPQFNTKLDGIHYRAIVDTGRAMIAIGSKMLPDSSIQEGDQLFIETNITPQPGDYILRKTSDAPEIAKFTTGDPPPIGVVYQLIRNYRQKE